MPNKISEAIVTVSQAYADNTILRMTVNAIPSIGSSLDVLFCSRADISRRRFGVLIEDLTKEMQGLAESKIDKSYVQSEEFSDLLFKIIDASFKTRSVEKLYLYAKFLSSAIIFENRSKIAIDDYLNTLVDLTPLELEVAKAIYNQQVDSDLNPNESVLQWAWRKGWRDLPTVLSIPEEDLPFILLRIQKSGLIHEITGSYLDYHGGVYILTPTFRKLMDFIGKNSLKQ